MTTTPELRVRRFHFETKDDPGYITLRDEIAQRGLRPMAASTDAKEGMPGDGTCWQIGDSIHDNQLTGIGPAGERVHLFDCRIIIEYDHHGRRKPTRRGYILEDNEGFDELQARRRHTLRCGSCGTDYPLPHEGGWCNACIGSPYLKEDDLPLTRLLPIADSFMAKRKDMDPPPASHVAAYRAAYGTTALRQINERHARHLADLDAKRAAADVEWRLATLLHAAGYGLGVTDEVICYSHDLSCKIGFSKALPSDLADRVEATLQEPAFADFKVRVERR